MRIAFYAPMKPTCDPRPSGDRRMARLLQAALVRGGFTVETASRFSSYDGTGDSECQSRAAAFGGRLAEMLIRRYERRARSQRPDLWFTYHLYHKAPDWLGPAVSGALSIPYVVAEASFAPKQNGGPWAVGHAGAGAAIAAADLVFNLNRADAAEVRSILVDPARLVPLNPFSEQVERTMGRSAGRRRARALLARRHAFAEAATPLLLCVAMMRTGDKLASYRCLARALVRLRDLPWRLLVVGDGPARSAVNAALAALGRRRVIGLGLCEGAKLAGAFAAADLFVWPAIGEAYGMAMLEAQAGGLPVVAGRTGGVPDIVAHGKSGLLAPVGEPQALAAAIRRLLVDPSRRTEMAKAARRKAMRHHGLSAAAARLRAHLLALLEASRP
ncbi:MAG: glycosyltransferase family 4 protein [Rhodospirillales bacterium]|nr:glycosyltransferase family 4 protein [Rhodospirillales bacterium]